MNLPGNFLLCFINFLSSREDLMKNILIILLVALTILTTPKTWAQKLNPGDGVRITFLDIKDNISGDYYIQPDGIISLPFIGEINTNNKEFPDIKNQIEFRYDSLYRDPHLTVHYLIRINVLGDVRNPGFYYITENEKFTALIALAGGTTADADLDNIYVVRGTQEIDLDIKSIIEEGGSVADFGLQSGDQVFVPRTWWSDRGITIVISAAALLVTVLAIIIRK
jgi:polysaccharide biosynthesis/export protein